MFTKQDIPLQFTQGMALASGCGRHAEVKPTDFGEDKVVDTLA